VQLLKNRLLLHNNTIGLEAIQPNIFAVLHITLQLQKYIYTLGQTSYALKYSY